MTTTIRASGGMATAPHRLASQAGADILARGGTAIEAMVAMAATIAVVYPHMNGIGGDGFWICDSGDGAPVGIAACGPAGRAATGELYAGRDAIPPRGPEAALTVAGTVGGWGTALEIGRNWGGRMPLPEILADAIGHARSGIAVTRSQARLTSDKLGELAGVPGFAETFLSDGAAPEVDATLRFEKLAATLERIGEAGTEDFYRGDLARSIARDLADIGAPLDLADLERYRPAQVATLSTRVAGAVIHNMPPPSQGASALAILGVMDRIGAAAPGPEAQLVHDTVEATKAAFRLRNAELFDPAYMRISAEDLVSPARLDGMAAGIDRARATPWPDAAVPGDTVWMGAIDGEGRSVSFIQSVYWEFGSGVVLPETGIQWQNRGIGFSLDPHHPNRLQPGRLPFHTLNPAMARFDDGRRMVYGTMGGEGQPQTQAAIFARHAWRGMDLGDAIAAPRWLLGRTWGEDSTNLKIESGIGDAVIEDLVRRGHEVEVVADVNDMMGHAGAVLRHPDGRIEGASDPRSDGAARPG